MKRLVCLLMLFLGLFMTDGTVQAEVYNNGGRFVEANGRIYFRVYSDGVFERKGFDGKFPESALIPRVDSSIVYYDRADGIVYPAFQDRGYGGIVYHDGWFYMQEACMKEGGGLELPRIYQKRADGTGYRVICDGYIRGASPDGSLMAVLDYDQGNRLRLFKNGVPTGAADIASEAGYFMVLGMDENYVYYLELWRSSEERGTIVHRMNEVGVIEVLDSYTQGDAAPELAVFDVSNGQGIAAVNEYEGSTRLLVGGHGFFFDGSNCTVMSYAPDEIPNWTADKAKWESILNKEAYGEIGTGYKLQHIEKLGAHDEYFATGAHYHKYLLGAAGPMMGTYLLGMDYLLLQGGQVTRIETVFEEHPFTAYCRLTEYKGRPAVVYQLTELNAPMGEAYNEGVSYVAPISDDLVYEKMAGDDAWVLTSFGRDVFMSDLARDNGTISPSDLGEFIERGCPALYLDQKVHRAYHIGFNGKGEINFAMPVLF